MVAKKGWNLITKRNSLVVRILKARYFPRSSVFDSNLGIRCTQNARILDTSYNNDLMRLKKYIYRILSLASDVPRMQEYRKSCCSGVEFMAKPKHTSLEW
jgi:hypothetical protein